MGAEATKRSYGTDNYKGTTWGVAVGAQEDQNYPIGGLRCYYTVKGGISGGWALAVDEPQINKASNNQKAILPGRAEQVLCKDGCPEPQQRPVRLDGVLRRPARV